MLMSFDVVIRVSLAWKRASREGKNEGYENTNQNYKKLKN